MMAARMVRTRLDARDAVAAAAEFAQQQLEIPSTAVVFEYLCGATNSLDPYSAYLTPDQLNDVYAQIEGNFVGLGVELKAQNGGLVIVRVIAGSPAEEAGVRAGDRILVIDGQSTGPLSTDQAANLLQGADGSVVALTLAAPGNRRASQRSPPPRRGAQRGSGGHRRSADLPAIRRSGIPQADLLPEDYRPRPRRRALETPSRGDAEPGG